MTQKLNLEKKIFRPTFRAVIILILGCFAFGIPSYIFSKTFFSNTFNLKNSLFEVAFTFLFIFFLLITVYNLLKIKVVCIDNLNLTIINPLLFWVRVISFDNITEVKISPQVIKANLSYGMTTIFEGQKVVVKFANGKKLNIDEFSTSDFDEILRKFQQKSLKITH